MRPAPARTTSRSRSSRGAFLTGGGATGTGENDVPAQIIAAEPDVVFVTMGLNDNFSYGFRAGDIRDQITEDLERLKSALPDARFLVVEPFWYTDEWMDAELTQLAL